MASRGSATNAVTHALIAHGIELRRLSASSTIRVIEFLREMQDDLAAQLRRSGVSASDARRLRALIADARRLIARTYREIADMQQGEWLNWANVEARVLAAVVNDAVGAQVMTAVIPRSHLAALVRDTLIRGAPSAQWWAQQGADVAQRFAQQVRLGVAAGESNPVIVERIRGFMRVNEAQAEALVRTSVQTVANEAALETFKRNADVIKGVRQVSTLDDRTTPVCRAYDGAEWTLEGRPMPGQDKPLPFRGGPPRHWNCRSILVPVVKTWRELGVDEKELSAPERASRDGPVRPGTTYNEWLQGRTRAEQDRILGRARADLWRRGKVSLRDLIDQRGRPLTLEQIKRRYGID